MNCQNLVPELDAKGNFKPRYRGGIYWAPCGGAMVLSNTYQNPEKVKPGTEPVRHLALLCGKCGAGQELLDFGNLDGVKRTKKKDLYKTKAVRAKGAGVRYMTLDGKGHKEVFPNSREARQAIPGIRGRADVLPVSVELVGA